jgi:tetratricopeptide (TPR) repeat protein
MSFSGSGLAQNKAAPFALYFSVDYQDSLGLYRDEPAILTVNISNPAITYAASWNKESRNYLAELEQQFNEGKISEAYFQQEQKSVNEGMISTVESQVGSLSEPWASKVMFKIVAEDGKEFASLPNRLLKSSRPSAIAILNEGAYFSAEYNLPAGSFKSLSAGNYHFIATLENVKSAPVRLTFKSEDMPVAIRNDEVMLLKIGQYYLQDEDPSKAISYADQILSRNANSLDGLVLRADSYLLMENYKNALMDYEQALALFYQTFPDSYEAPEYLLAMIEYVREKE